METKKLRADEVEDLEVLDDDHHAQGEICSGNRLKSTMLLFTWRRGQI